MSRFYIAHVGRRHLPAVAGPFRTLDSAREYLQAVATGPGVILRRDGDELLPVITLRRNGTEIQHQPVK